MASGDGLIVRIRTGARALTSRELRALAALAHEHGNGIIELTRRANLQLRGLRSEHMLKLQEQLIALGLVDASPAREGRPGLLVDPLAAISNAELSVLAQGLDQALAESSGRLSAKLGVVLDAGSGSVSGVDADIRVVVSGSVEPAQIFVGTRAGAELLGECERAHAADAVKALLHALSEFARVNADTDCVAGSNTNTATTPNHDASLSAANSGKSRNAPRMRDLAAAHGLTALRACVEGIIATSPQCIGSGPQLTAALGFGTGAATAQPEIPRDSAAACELASQPQAALGFHAVARDGWFGVGVAFGSASHAEWVAIADLAEGFGSAEVRLTPEREVLILGVRAEHAERLEQVARRLGLITQPNDPRRQLIACSGAPACSSAYGETRSFASSLGAELEPLLAAGATLHVSGCEKGCASRAAADFSIVLAVTGARLALNADVAAASGAPIETLTAISARLRAKPFQEPLR